MSIEVHIIAFNEERMMPYTLRHYTSFASRIVVHDGGSTDRTHAICAEYEAEVKNFPTDGVNDKLFKELKETCWKGTAADWVICVDADELVYFPGGVFDTLSAYDKAGLPVATPRGYEMFSDNLPVSDRQIYDEVKMGAPDPEWYSKKVLFSPARLRSIEFSAGAHETWYIDHDGKKVSVSRTPSEPAFLFLHFHHLGTLEEMAARYRRQQSRHSKTNIANKWGNFEDPMKHAKDKRAKIVPRLTRVIE